MLTKEETRLKELNKIKNKMSQLWYVMNEFYADFDQFQSLFGFIRKEFEGISSSIGDYSCDLCYDEEDYNLCDVCWKKERDENEIIEKKKEMKRMNKILKSKESEND